LGGKGRDTENCKTSVTTTCDPRTHSNPGPKAENKILNRRKQVGKTKEERGKAEKKKNINYSQLVEGTYI
jgi:hypothetical protein